MFLQWAMMAQINLCICAIRLGPILSVFNTRLLDTIEYIVNP